MYVVVLAFALVGCGQLGEKPTIDLTADCEIMPSVYLHDYGDGAGDRKSNAYNCRQSDGSTCQLVHYVNDPSIRQTNCSGRIVTDAKAPFALAKSEEAP